VNSLVSASLQTALVGRFGRQSSERARGFGRIDVRSTYFLIAVMSAAVLLRLYGMSAYPLQGDEYQSLAEAKSVGLNWNSIVYSSLLHFWSRWGSTELWLRLPAAIFGVATVPILHRVGQRLGGSRAGWVAAILAATSPFNIYHSQEVRFYSLLMFAAALFMLATMRYADSEKSLWNRSAVVASGVFLLVSHFLGVIAVSAQTIATLVALKKKRTGVAILSAALFILIFGLPLIPPLRASLLHLYVVYGNAAGAPSVTTPVSLIGLAKTAFALYAFVFGYHVYPLRLVLVITGLSLSAFLLLRGVTEIKRERRWKALPLCYGVALVGVFLLLDSIGGRVANGVSPRHVAFVWPAFIAMVSVGVSSLGRRLFFLILAGLLTVNAISLAYGWQKDWSYGPATDYRAAAEFASRWQTNNAGLLFVGRAGGPGDFYFPKDMARVNSYSDLFTPGLTPQYDRLIVVSDDWAPDRRLEVSHLLKQLSESYTFVAGRVEYPLFEYVFDRKAIAESREFAAHPATGNLQMPLSIYGLEFQDLKLPLSVTTSGATLQIDGATELPNFDGEPVATISFPTTSAKRIMLVTNMTDVQSLTPGTDIAEVVIQNKSTIVGRFPLRLGIETAAWDAECQSSAPCKTAFQWHKRFAVTGQNSYPGAWRDFQAGIHAVAIDLPANTNADNVSLHYLATSGRLHVWAVAVMKN